MPNNLLSLMDRILDNSMPVVHSNFYTGVPAINVHELKDKYEVVVNAAGINPDKLNLEIQDRVLTISYEDKKEEKNEDDKNMLRQEYYEYVSFSRSVALPKNVDESSIKADYKKGLLTVTVNKTPDAQPKKIKVSSSEK